LLRSDRSGERLDAMLRRMLATPPQPKVAVKKAKAKKQAKK